MKATYAGICGSVPLRPLHNPREDPGREDIYKSGNAAEVRPTTTNPRAGGRRQRGQPPRCHASGHIRGRTLESGSGGSSKARHALAGFSTVPLPEIDGQALSTLSPATDHSNAVKYSLVTPLLLQQLLLLLLLLLLVVAGVVVAGAVMGGGRRRPRSRFAQFSHQQQ